MALATAKAPKGPTTRVELPYLFDPWPHQEEWFTAFYDHGIRRFMEVVHRRGGKDKGFLNLMINEMTQRVGNYCHVFPQRNRARLIVWQGIDSEGRRYIDHFPPPLIYRKREQEMMVSLRHPDEPWREGSIYWCMGSDKDVYLLVGTNPVGIIWSEFAEIDPRMRELVLPILRRNGGWEAIVCTPRGRNHAYRLFNTVRSNTSWHVTYLSVRETSDHQGKPLVTDADIEQDKADGMSQEAIDQEYFLAWEAPMPGSYYAEEFRRIDAQGRIRQVPYDPAYPVLTAWDLGRNDCNAIWFVQIVGREIRVIDYEEGPNIALAREDGLADDDTPKKTWIDIVRAKPYIYDHSKVLPPLTQSPYEIHYGPHDLEVHEYSYGKTRYTIALRHGLRFTVVPSGTIEDGIAAGRALLERAVFDEHACARGLDALRDYRREFDQSKQVFLNHPEHNWASNGADAWRYLAVGIMPPPKPKENKPEDIPGTFAWERKQALAARRGGRIRTRSAPAAVEAAGRGGSHRAGGH